jgi:hypothetical protein
VPPKIATAMATLIAIADTTPPSTPVADQPATKTTASAATRTATLRQSR